MAKINLPNGIVLDSNGHWAESAQAYTRQKGFADARVFVATHPNGHQNYLLVIGERPEYENTSFEAIVVHIDMMAACRDMPE